MPVAGAIKMPKPLSTWRNLVPVVNSCQGLSKAVSLKAHPVEFQHDSLNSDPNDGHDISPTSNVDILGQETSHIHSARQRVEHDGDQKLGGNKPQTREENGGSNTRAVLVIVLDLT